MTVTTAQLSAKKKLSQEFLTEGGGRRVTLREARSLDIGMATVRVTSLPVVHSVGVMSDDGMGKPRLNLYFSPEFLLESTENQIDAPSEVDGIPVHFISAPMATISPRIAPQCEILRRQKQRPAPAGISIGHFKITAGTLGCYCRKRGDDKLYILSNNHVLADVNKGKVGDPIYQPGAADGGTAADSFAKLSAFTPIVLSQTANNRTDAAIAAVDNPSTANTAICSIGAVTGTIAAQTGMVVQKMGRTTGLTKGVISEEALDVLVGMDHNDPNVVARFDDQLRIEQKPGWGAFGLGGDSGSLVLEDNTRRAVGLFFAGPSDGSYGIANPIDVVLSALDITLITGQ